MKSKLPFTKSPFDKFIESLSANRDEDNKYSLILEYLANNKVSSGGVIKMLGAAAFENEDFKYALIEAYRVGNPQNKVSEDDMTKILVGAFVNSERRSLAIFAYASPDFIVAELNGFPDNKERRSQIVAAYLKNSIKQLGADDVIKILQAAVFADWGDNWAEGSQSLQYRAIEFCLQNPNTKLTVADLLKICDSCEWPIDHAVNNWCGRGGLCVEYLKNHEVDIDGLRQITEHVCGKDARGRDRMKLDVAWMSFHSIMMAYIEKPNTELTFDEFLSLAKSVSYPYFPTLYEALASKNGFGAERAAPDFVRLLNELCPDNKELQIRMLTGRNFLEDVLHNCEKLKAFIDAGLRMDLVGEHFLKKALTTSQDETAQERSEKTKIAAILMLYDVPIQDVNPNNDPTIAANLQAVETLLESTKQEYARDQAIHFALGKNPRLGKDSAVSMLVDDMVREILEKMIESSGRNEASSSVKEGMASQLASQRLPTIGV